MKAIITSAIVLSFLLFNAVTQPRMRPSTKAAGSPQATKPGQATHMLYDTERRQVVLLTASKQSGLEELWSWNGKQWQFIPGSGPAARELGGAVYDTRRKRIVLHGGMGLNPDDLRRGDTWEWDGKTWQQMTDTSVGTRDHHTMAYDEARGKTVLYGGAKLDRSAPTETWEWDGRKWTMIATPGPGTRHHFPMVYDSQRKQVVLFGGLSQDYKLHHDTWAWDGKTWQKLSDGGPPPRYHHRMAFDSQSGVIVLFGGLGGGQPPATFDDTWIWDGQHWTEIKTASPSKRSDNVMAYDPVRHRVVLFGGSYWDGKVTTHYDDTWEWDGKQWSEVK